MMPQIWDSDIELTPEEAARLIARQFPALSPVQLDSFGSGWDNTAFLVNERLVFRFPRRRFAVQFMEQELRVLPLLAGSLPLPIPMPEFLGSPEETYPYPFAGYSLIAGKTGCRHDWSSLERERNAVPIARFLAALHNIPLHEETLAWAPRDDIQRANLQKRAPQVKDRLRTIAPLLNGIQIHILLDLIERLGMAHPYRGQACWVHGDLYARHLLVDDSHHLCGVIDWGDVHIGDPALDLSVAFSFLPPGGRDLFRANYGTIDGATWDRARFRAIHYGAVLVEYGADVGDAAMKQIGEYALQAALIIE